MNAGSRSRTGTFLAGVVATTMANAQPMHGPRGGMARMPAYDSRTAVTLSGTVEGVVERSMPMGFVGVHLIMKTGKDTVEVHVGPKSFVSTLGMDFAKGDTIEVTGSRMMLNGVDSLLSREIKKDGKTITLRDEKGVPRWSGSPQRT